MAFDPAELLGCGGEAMVQCLHSFAVAAFNSGNIPQQWKDADIISIYKKKGDRSICGNSRGISLLSCGGKVIAKILLTRLIEAISEHVLPESQCGFRRDRGTVDMVFVARLLQEKCIEQHQNLYMVFVDLTKAFDTVNRELLWEVLKRFGCPPRFLAVVQSLHSGAMARVLGEGLRSDPFAVGSGVRQGCVIAPVIFNLFLAAVMAAARRDIHPDDGMKLAYRLDGSLFNLRRLRAPTKVTRDSIIELQYTDDAAIVGCGAEAVQRNVSAIGKAYSRSGLTVNIDKTETMSIRQGGVDPAIIYIDDNPLKTVDRFTYLGSVLNTSGNITDDVQRRIGLASAAFGRLAERVFYNRNLRVQTKVAVYKAVCLSVLLYASEAWVLYRKHLKSLERFHTQSLQRILGLKWWHRVTHVEVRSRAGVEPVETMLIGRQLRWYGHTLRMPANRLPRQVLYGELEEGRRSVGGQRKRYKDLLKVNLQKCGMQPQNLERLAADRDGWRAACREGLDTHLCKYNLAAEEKRTRRHQLRDRPQHEQHHCEICGRECASQIGLISHRRAHQRRVFHRRE